jgi:Cu/Ag efflux protein CusF
MSSTRVGRQLAAQGARGTKSKTGELNMKPTIAILLGSIAASGVTLSQSAPMVSATVEKIDPAEGKITLDHGRIPNLDMDAMTMVFRAQDPAMLKSVKQGDKVQFAAERVNGQITVTRIQKAK